MQERVHLGEHDGERLPDPLIRLVPVLASQDVCNDLKNAGRLVTGAARCRQPGSQGRKFPRAAHLERVKQQQYAVGRCEGMDVLLRGLLGSQVLARRVEDGKQRVLWVPAAGRASSRQRAVQEPRRTPFAGEPEHEWRLTAIVGGRGRAQQP